MTQTKLHRRPSPHDSTRQIPPRKGRRAFVERTRDTEELHRVKGSNSRSRCTESKTEKKKVSRSQGLSRPKSTYKIRKTMKEEDMVPSFGVLEWESPLLYRRNVIPSLTLDSQTQQIFDSTIFLKILQKQYLLLDSFFINFLFFYIF